MLHPPLASMPDMLPIFFMLLVFWAIVSIGVAVGVVVVVGPRQASAVVLPAIGGFVAGMLFGGLGGALPFIAAGGIIVALLQRRWLGQSGLPGSEGLPWGHQPAARIVARRRAVRRAREDASRDAAPD